MSISTLALLTGDWRDYSGMWNPRVEPYIAPLDISECHNPRWAMAPSLDEQLIPVGGKTTYNFKITPGSIIWGLIFYSDADFITTYQLTDVGLGHKLFQAPPESGATSNDGFDAGNMPSTFILPTPWPVTGEGLFTLEIWAEPTSRAFILLGVAEVNTCQPAQQ